MKTNLTVTPNPGGVLSAGVCPGCHSESRRRFFRRGEESLGVQTAKEDIQLIRVVHDETSPEILRPTAQNDRKESVGAVIPNPGGVLSAGMRNLWVCKPR